MDLCWGLEKKGSRKKSSRLDHGGRVALVDREEGFEE
jgi:hypothetical protein